MRIRLLLISMCAALAAQAAPNEKTVGAKQPAAAEPARKKAEWVDRCDRLAQDKRFACLEKLREEALARYLENAASDNPAKEKEAVEPQTLDRESAGKTGGAPRQEGVAKESAPKQP